MVRPPPPPHHRSHHPTYAPPTSSTGGHAASYNAHFGRCTVSQGQCRKAILYVYLSPCAKRPRSLRRASLLESPDAVRRGLRKANGRPRSSPPTSQKRGGHSRAKRAKNTDGPDAATSRLNAVPLKNTRNTKKAENGTTRGGRVEGTRRECKKEEHEDYSRSAAAATRRRVLESNERPTSHTGLPDARYGSS